MKEHQRKSDLRKEIHRMNKSRDEWKEKNKERYEENKTLRARIIESRQSRNEWKNEYKNLKKELEVKDQLINALKIKLEQQGGSVSEMKEELERVKKNYPSMPLKNN